ncbi:hypothetical protein HS961_13510 [Comamonas piscis]|uniref:DUF1877 family protein n=1 Tax=Comamonas piscis TaxID=1562974 RepID=A0A7G5EID9_9BURK|nr:hypothetical protein [Comamonas piscis]QMV73764.1 hypothetical protein HS961_13510 [Comamonas piscis]WSO32188.1 hypothetical protein VUJ63_13550 [Comamonas piscis]
MSVQGLFYALPRHGLRALLVEPSGIDDYLQRHAEQGGPLAMLDQGSWWQQDMQRLSEIEAGVAVDGTLAQHCWAWPADLVTDSAQGLSAITATQLVQRMHAWQKAQDGMPPDIDALRYWVRRQAALRSFWQAAAQRRDAVLLYVV